MKQKEDKCLNKNRISLFILVFLCFPLFYSCIREKFPEKVNQVVFWYLPWSSNLTSFFEENLRQMEGLIKQNILRNERMIVFFARSSTEADLFEIVYERGECEKKILKKYTKSYFTLSYEISSLLNDVFAFAPADRYAMIVSGHGMGWLPASSAVNRPEYMNGKPDIKKENVLLTRYYGGLESQYQTEVKKFAEGVLASSIKKFEYILFDNCYMSTVEVVYDLKEVCHYLIACPTEILAYGFPYTEIGRHLFGKVNYQQICDDFISFYKQYELMPCGAIGVTKCSEIDSMALLMREINLRFCLNPNQLNNIQRMDGYHPSIFFDFENYVSNFCDDPELLSKFHHHLDQLIPPKYRMHTESFYTMNRGKIPIKNYSGLVISDPSTNMEANKKTETAWYKATH